MNSTAKGWNRPKALICHICGREFGTASLAIHQKTCAKLWEERESKKPKSKRRPVPQAPSEIPVSGSATDIDFHNQRAFAYFESKVMKPCPNCQRTFLEERLPIHLRSCTAEKPHKPVGAPKSPEPVPRAQSPKPVTPRSVTPKKQDYEECPYCYRKFLSNVAERHIPICKETKHRPKPPPTATDFYSKKTPTRKPVSNTKSNIFASPEPTQREFKPQPKVKLFCHICGEKYLEKANYCAYCGTKR